TPAYMSPEQARGAPVDARSDLFSVGTTLFELITGTNPFAGATESASILRVMQDDAPLLFEADPTLPPKLEAIVARLLARDADAPYQSAAEALADFAAASPEVFRDPRAVLKAALADPAAAIVRWREAAAVEASNRGITLLAEGPARRPMAILQLVR